MHRNRLIETTILTAFIFLLMTASLYSHTGPFDGVTFKGRIAFSADGNYNDEDDWGAFPVAMAMFHTFGVIDKLVHVDYNNILPKSDPRFQKEMTESVLGAAERFGISPSILFNCQEDVEGAVESIKKAINESSAENPLYFILSGPMEVPFRGIEKSAPEKRQYVYCISHSAWNDGYNRTDQELFTHNKRDVILSGIQWIQIKDGNPNLAHPGGVGKVSTLEQWSLYHWLRDSNDSNLQWIFTRLEAEKRCDISDSTITYFLLTGDEEADLVKLNHLLNDKTIPDVINQRTVASIEAENFRHLNRFNVEFGDRLTSHRLNAVLKSSVSGRIATPFDQIYTDSGHYDVHIRYFDDKAGRSRYTFFINDVQQGNSWAASDDDQKWKTHTIPEVSINTGDEIAVEIQNDSDEKGKLDWVQLHFKKK